MQRLWNLGIFAIFSVSLSVFADVKDSKEGLVQKFVYSVSDSMKGDEFYDFISFSLKDGTIQILSNANIFLHEDFFSGLLEMKATPKDVKTFAKITQLGEKPPKGMVIKEPHNVVLHINEKPYERSLSGAKMVQDFALELLKRPAKKLGGFQIRLEKKSYKVVHYKKDSIVSRSDYPAPTCATLFSTGTARCKTPFAAIYIP